ncbi:MAG: TIGR04211 family SH3 domain-containing protein [Deltaproteobacteria bacterium]|jgi:SH3 domain protein|nr:TIGR04211 family SH3 domain-containing protein [Deltaproteobacteria bacterium]
MMKLRLMIGLILLSVLSGQLVYAETRYVSDQLVITLREGMGNRFKVIKTLPTDSRLEVLSEQDNYLYVRAEDGVEGYVLKQYISRKKPKTMTIAQLRVELATVNKKMTDLLQSADGSGKELQTVRTRSAELSEALKLSEELLETTKTELLDLQVKSENVVLIDEERQRLKTDLSAVRKELEHLRQENHSILNEAMIKWFLAGSGVMSLGWIAGKFSRKKKRGLGSF